jgi:ATP-dependent Clp protease ATP-binding subunit ClpC
MAGRKMADDKANSTQGGHMFERFTDRARKIIAMANQEALHFNHEYIGTEHMLLGLVKEGSGVGANVLKNLKVDLPTVRREVEKLIKVGPKQIPQSKLPQTPRAKRVIECAMEESRRLGHNYVGSEHLLLGLIREDDGVGAQVLMNMGLHLQRVQNEVLKILSAGGETPEFIENIVYSTPEARRAGDRAAVEARNMRHRSVGTGHILLGLLGEERGMAARLLTRLGVNADTVREEIVKQGGREAEA